MHNYQNLISTDFNRNILFENDFHIIKPNSTSHFYAAEFNDQLGLHEDFDVKNYLFYKPISIKGNVYDTAFVVREIRKGNILIREIINPQNGTIITSDSKGITYDDYENLKNSYDDHNFIDNFVKCQTTCYTTFQACFDDIANGNGSPEDAVACDFVTCNLIAYVTCTFEELEGWIEESDNFVGCAIVMY